jgi:hypothetical protein
MTKKRILGCLRVPPFEYHCPRRLRVVVGRPTHVRACKSCFFVYLTMTLKRVLYSVELLYIMNRNRYEIHSSGLP